MILRLTGLGLLAALTPGHSWGQDPAQAIAVVSLTDAIQMARTVRPAMIQAMTTLRNADAQRRSALGAYMPNLNATSSGGRSYQEFAGVDQTGRPRAPGTTKDYGFGLTASLDLFTGLRRRADDRAAGATTSAAEAGLTDAEFQTSLTVTQQFFDALAAQQLVRVREASVRRAGEQLNLSIAKLRVGSATRSDSLRSIVNRGNALLALVNATSDVARTQSALGRTLGLEGRVGAQDDSAFYNFSLGLDTAALQQEARDRSPRVQAAEASARAADAAVKAARATYWPTLALSGSANWNSSTANTDTLTAPLLGRRSLSLGLSWPIFNRFQREQTITNRQSTLQVAEANAADARREVHSTLTTQFAALESARVRIEITTASVEAATEDLRVVNERYRVGAATILDILNSQEALAQAEVDGLAARFDYLKAKAQIETLIGRRL